MPLTLRRVAAAPADAVVVLGDGPEALLAGLGQQQAAPRDLPRRFLEGEFEDALPLTSGDGRGQAALAGGGDIAVVQE